MKTALSSSSPWIGRDLPAPSIEETAQSILESYADDDSAPDDSLGAYVTQVLQNDEDEDALVELLTEHCQIDAERARSALNEIRTLLTTGQRPLSVGTLPAALASLSVATDNNQEESAAPPAAATSVISPLHEDNLIPVDLLGALDETNEQRSQAENLTPPIAPAPAEPCADPFPPLGLAASSSKKKPRPKGPKKVKSKSANDLVAVLFSPSERTRAVEEAPASSPSALVEQPMEDEPAFQSTVEILLTMNPDLSEEAATAAAKMAQTDINIAQYLVDMATTAPPVCRHLLGDGCYRADCQYSHDVLGHTCIFWLHGRCGKGESCRFLHGFNDKVLEEIPAYEAQQGDEAYAAYEPAYGQGYSGDTYGASFLANGGAASWGPLSSLEQNSGYSTVTAAPRSGPPLSSFANIASRGCQTNLSFASAGQVPSANAPAPSTVKIPQDLWTAHEHRDASAFYIADPLQRYHQVSSNARKDVIDLHFQSTKSMPDVLAEVLPAKLQTMDQVWIITGTGHHVGSKTHQKSGGALEAAVVDWLTDEGYLYARGRDRNGQGGAVLVMNR